MAELATLPTFNVDFKESVITIDNEAQFEDMVNTYANKYRGLIVTEYSKDADKKIKQQINKVAKNIDEQRKAVKRAYSTPLSDFEAKANKWRDTLKEVADDIDSGVKLYEEREEAERLEKVEALIAEMAPAYGVEPANIEIDKSWSNKSLSKIGLERAIKDKLGYAAQVKEQREKDIKTITMYARKYQVAPEPFIQQLDILGDATLVLMRIDEAIEAEEQRSKAEEAKRKATLEAEKASLVQNGDKYVEPETGEVVQEQWTVSFKMQGTKEQLDEIARIIANSNVSVIESSKREAVLVKEF